MNKTQQMQPTGFWGQFKEITKAKFTHANETVLPPAAIISIAWRFALENHYLTLSVLMIAMFWPTLLVIPLRGLSIITRALL